MAKNSVLFKESQKFEQWWLWSILVILEGFMIYAVVYQVILGGSVGNKPAPDILLILLTLTITTPLIVLFAALRLDTEFNELEIICKWFPFTQKVQNILWNDVRNVEIINYSFVGFGIRFSDKYGIVHNVSGNIGIQFYLKNGEKIMIGTNRPNELRVALNRLADKNIIS